jgi:peptide/nickel transport system ATP-binding protein
MDNLLDIDDLAVEFRGRSGTVRAVDGLSLYVAKGETVAIVGESGCGKSVTALSIMRLLSEPAGRICGGAIRFDGQDLAALSEGHAQGARPGHLHGVSGADDQSQPGPDRGSADR